MIARIALCLFACTLYRANAEVDLITEPQAGQEYVLVSSGQQTPIRNFETSHKIPDKHPQHRFFKPEDGSEKITKKLLSGKAKHPSEGIVAIEEDKKALFKKGLRGKSPEAVEIDLPVSKIEDIKIKENSKHTDNHNLDVDLEAMSESGKLSSAPGTTTQKPVLTTTRTDTTKAYDYIPINFDSIDDINSGLLSSNVQLETAGSEQQNSRIQIKKGPNGQDYEYEYIYYYYDEEDGGKKEKEGKDKGSTTSAPGNHNSHDGPQKAESDNQIGKESKNKSKYSSIDRTGTTTTPATSEQNEVLPSAGRSRQRSRNVAPAPVEEKVEEDRLPSSTRFPPRGRNLAATTTTTAPELTTEAVRQRGRPQIDNIADESIGQTRSRTRAHIRRPSSELVDLDSFKTGELPSQYKDQPSRYSSESKTTTEIPEALPTAKEPTHAKDSPREGHSLASGIIFQEILDDSKLPADYKQTTTYEQDTTEYTTMTAMEKVALDLYAYLAGENLNNEINPTNDGMFDGSTTVDDEGWTTEALSTTEEATTPTTTSTTTTTTTTTTPAPTTTTSTTQAPVTRPSRFKGRPGARAKVSSTSAATEAPQETSTRTRGRFSKPGGARRTTAAAPEASTAAPVTAEKAVTQPKAFGRRGLFGGRTRPSSTTAAPAQEDGSVAASETPAPRSRPRPGLRRPLTTSTTAAPAASDEESAGGSGEPAETTPTPSRTIGRPRPNARPASLRPGARLNLRANARLRPGAAATEVASEAPAETSAPEAASTDAEAEGSSPTPAPEAPARGGVRIRNRLQVAPSPKPRITQAPPLRRPNPLIKRKLATTEATTEAAKKSSTETIEESTSAEKSETETEAQPAESTPAPPLRGLDALIARRRAAGGVGARPVRPARGAPYPK